MWIYTIYGFFSVVQKSGDPELTIRSRVRADLERLKARYLPKMSEISESDLSDYKFRAKATHAAFANAIYHIAQDIDYSNFKDAVHDHQGPERADAYMKVWDASFGLRKVPDTLSDEDKQKSPNLSSLKVSQRLMMRALNFIHEYEAMRVWRSMPFYAVTEKLGLVKRDSDENDMSAEEYAKALLKDGYTKGWVNTPLSQDEWHSVFTAFVYQFLWDGATFRNGQPWTD